MFRLANTSLVLDSRLGGVNILGNLLVGGGSGSNASGELFTLPSCTMSIRGALGPYITYGGRGGLVP